MSTFTTPLALAPTAVAAGTILPVDAIPHASSPVSIGDEPLDVRWIDGRNWLLLTEFDFASEVLERLITIPAGFVTDFASTPRVLWPLLPPTGPWGKPSLVHDRLYRSPEIVCTRRAADQTFLEAMVALRTHRLTQWAMYVGVRVCGRSAFKPRAAPLPPAKR